MSTIDLTYVLPGTYADIAKRLGYSQSYVAKVAAGQRRNARIEEHLLRAVIQRKNIEARRARFKKLLKHKHNG